MMSTRVRLTTACGWQLGLAAGLPNHVDPEDWRLMPAGTSQLIDDIDIDIADRGFCFFQTYIEMMASAGS
jgi:hypothetical protein